MAQGLLLTFPLQTTRGLSALPLRYFSSKTTSTFIPQASKALRTSLLLTQSGRLPHSKSLSLASQDVPLTSFAGLDWGHLIDVGLCVGEFTQQEEDRGKFFNLRVGVLLDMSKSRRPPCIGMYGLEDGCEACGWREECQRMTEGIDSAVTRKGTHVRIVSKYKEKKYKPKRI